MIRILLDILFPPRCVGCGARGSWICGRCSAGFTRLAPNRCSICARPNVASDLCSACRIDPPSFQTVHCAFHFEGCLREAIHRLKYQGARHLADPLSSCALRSIGPLPPFDAVIPIPLHPTRLAQRGFNQSGLLARSIGRALDVPVVEDKLRRIRDTPSQITLTVVERRRNVQGAFATDPGVLIGKSILLVDDVATTGSTLRAAAFALRHAGARSVDGLVLARAV